MMSVIPEGAEIWEGSAHASSRVITTEPVYLHSIFGNLLGDGGGIKLFEFDGAAPIPPVLKVFLTSTALSNPVKIDLYNIYVPTGLTIDTTASASFIRPTVVFTRAQRGIKP